MCTRLWYSVNSAEIAEADLSRSANRTGSGIVAVAVALGMTSITAQIILLREFVAIFHGNELVLGIAIGNWMLLTAAGSFLGHLSYRFAGRRRALPFALFSLSLLPLLSVFFLRFLRNVLFTAGSMIDIAQTVLVSAVVLAPFCVAAGILFAFLAFNTPKHSGAGQTGLVYGWEAAGSVAGGVVFNIVLLSVLDTFQILALLLAVNMCLVTALAWTGGLSRSGIAFTALLILALGYVSFLKLDALTRGFLFPGQDIVAFKDTPYGNLTVTRQGNQLNFFENSLLLFSTDDMTTNEESVHYALLQRPLPRRVLLIGGGISGTAQEILKHGVRRIDYLEMNPWIIGVGRKYTETLADDRIAAITGDPRVYVRSTPERYDAALVNVPDPGTVQINRYYTREFFHELKRVLTDSAVVSISLLPGADYQGPEARRVGSILYATLRTAFARVLVVPGGRDYFLASDGALDIRMSRLVRERGIPTVYVNGDYLDDRLLERRSAGIVRQFDMSSIVNTDFQPVCYFRQVEYWTSVFGFHPGPWILLAASGAVLLLLWRSSAIHMGVFAGGFTASALEIAVLIAFQAICGSLYQMTGVIITAFMAGLTAGSLVASIRSRRPGIGAFIWMQGILAACALALPVILLQLKMAALPLFLIEALFVVITFCIGALVGAAFAVATRIPGERSASVASRFYGLDLAGSAIGAFAVSVYILPLFGITWSALIAGVVSAGGASLCFLSRKRFIQKGV
jgi:spermidine synthase